MMTQLKRFRFLILPGLLIAVLRIALEVANSDAEGPQHVSMQASVYYATLALWLVAGVTGLLKGLGWKRLLGGAALATVAIWFIPHCVAYTTAQFQEWNFGRFYFDQEFHERLAELEESQPDLGEAARVEAVEEELGRSDQSRSAPVAESAGSKIGMGLLGALGTTVAGILWNLAFAALFVGTTMGRRTDPLPDGTAIGGR